MTTSAARLGTWRDDDLTAEIHLPEMVSARELLQRRYPPPVFLWGTFWARGERAMTTGPQKRGRKTYLLMSLAAHLAWGVEFLGQTIPHRVRVLYVDAEMGMESLHHRARTIVEAAGIPEEALDNLFFLSLRGEGIDLDSCTEQLLDIVKVHGIDVVLIDPITDAVTVDENKSADVKALLRMIQDPLADAGVATMIVHHTPKGTNGRGYSGGENARGSAGWGERQDVTLQCSPAGESSGVRLEAQTRHRLPPPPIEFEIGPEGGLQLCGASRGAPAKAGLKERLLSLLEDREWHPHSKLREKLGITGPTLSHLLNTAESKGVIERRDPEAGEDGRLRFVRLAPSWQQNPGVSR